LGGQVQPCITNHDGATRAEQAFKACVKSYQNQPGFKPLSCETIIAALESAAPPKVAS